MVDDVDAVKADPRASLDERVGLVLLVTSADAAKKYQQKAKTLKRKHTMENYYNKMELKQRGWTDASIRDFLGDPDDHRDNPYYRSSPPMCLYLIERVKKVEQSPGFISWSEKSKIRKEASKAVVANKRSKLLEMVQNLEIEVDEMDYKTLIQLAVDHYNTRQYERENFDHDDIDPSECSPDSEFTQRIMVNFLRHEATEYDDHLQELFGKVGKNDGYILLNQKIYDAIMDVYPDLETECKRQLERKKEWNLFKIETKMNRSTPTAEDLD